MAPTPSRSGPPTRRETPTPPRPPGASRSTPRPPDPIDSGPSGPTRHDPDLHLLLRGGRPSSVARLRPIRGCFGARHLPHPFAPSRTAPTPSRSGRRIPPGTRTPPPPRAASRSTPRPRTTITPAPRARPTTRPRPSPSPHRRRARASSARSTQTPMRPAPRRRPRHLADGPHTFYVRANRSGGQPDPTPASRSFTVQTASVHVSGSTLVVTAARGPPTTSDHPSLCLVLRVTDLASGAYTGSGVHAGRGAPEAATTPRTATPRGITLIRVSSGSNRPGGQLDRDPKLARRRIGDDELIGGSRHGHPHRGSGGRRDEGDERKRSAPRP